MHRDRIQLFLKQLSKLVVPEYISEQFNKTHEVLSELNYTTERLMFEVMQPCREMLEVCTWLGKVVPCETLFRVATSAEGFCCSFNYKAPLDSHEVLVYYIIFKYELIAYSMINNFTGIQNMITLKIHLQIQSIASQVLANMLALKHLFE